MNKITDKIAKMESFFRIDTVSYIEGKVQEGLYSQETLVNLEKILNGEKITKDLFEKVDALRRDRRTHEEFVIDIILAWLMEDHIFNKLSNDNEVVAKYKILRSGTDAKREFKKLREIRRTSDLKLENRDTGEIVYIEVMEDRTGFVKKAGFFNLRSGKLKFLQSEIDKPNVNSVHVIILDLENNEYILYRVNGNEDLGENKLPAFGFEYATKTKINGVDGITYSQDKIGKAIANIA